MVKYLINNKLIKLLVIITVLINCDSNTNNTNNASQKSDKKVMIDTLNIIKEQKVIHPKGNQILDNSEKLYNLKWENGYILNAINISQCDNSKTDEGVYEFEKK